jgi:hypothetical protein
VCCGADDYQCQALARVLHNSKLWNPSSASGLSTQNTPVSAQISVPSRIRILPLYLADARDQRQGRIWGCRPRELPCYDSMISYPGRIIYCATDHTLQNSVPFSRLLIDSKTWISFLVRESIGSREDFTVICYWLSWCPSHSFFAAFQFTSSNC